MKKKLKKPSIRTINHKDGGMSFYAEGGEFDFVRNQTPNVPTNFEQRMYHTPYIDNEDGSMSSHEMMSWSDENGEHAAPTIVYQNGKLAELTPDEAIDYAYKNGEMKTFNSFEEAYDYANNGYKQNTPMEIFAPNKEFEPNALYGGRNSYAAGGSINPSWPKPTATDSLSLYKTALSANNFYENEFKNDYNKLRTLPYEKYLKLNQVDHTSLINLYNKEKQEYNILKNRPYRYNREFGTSYHTNDLINKYKNTGNFTGVSNMLFGEHDPYFNPRVPVTYLHPGILPQKINQYESKKFTDAADVPYYDPIAIKPYKLLTPKERKLREQRYGKPVSNITKKPKSIVSKVVEETSGPKVVREIPAPLNPAYKPRTTGIPFLLSDEVVNTTTPMTPSVPVAPTTTTSKTPMTANPTKWFSLDGSGNKVLIDNQYLTRDEFEKFKVANPNFNYSQKPDSVGRKYNMGGGIELSNRMFEEGGEYELTNEEIRDLQSQGYDIELL